MKRMFTLPTILTWITLISPLACSSGGGGTTQNSPAYASLSVEPYKIDSGDRTMVDLFVTDIATDQIAIKVRFPSGLGYVHDSSYRVEGDKLIDTAPTTSVTSTDGYNYLVYYINQQDLKDSGNAKLIFELEGVQDVPSGKVEVDIDRADPEVRNSREFNSTLPKFDPQNFDDVVVGKPAPTPTTTKK